MKNILYNTTRQWNCGDEFILLGTINLIKRFIGDHNPIIYDRNPDVTSIELRQRKSNSWSGQDFAFDYYISAGTPEWTGGRNTRLHNYISSKNINSALIGIGKSHAPSPETISLLKKANFITCRDKQALAVTERYNKKSTCLPCPAIFSSNKFKKIKDTKNIAIGFQSDKVRWHSINPNLKKRLIEFIKKVKENKNYNLSIVCHYHSEVYEAKKIFPDVKIYYSYDSKDYIDIYRKFDLVVSTRLHGCLCALSNGVPVIMPLNRDSIRCDGAAAEIPVLMRKNFDEIIIEDIDSGQINQEIKKFKADSLNLYSKILKDKF